MSSRLFLTTKDMNQRTFLWLLFTPALLSSLWINFAFIVIQPILGYHYYDEYFLDKYFLGGQIFACHIFLFCFAILFVIPSILLSIIGDFIMSQNIKHVGSYKKLGIGVEIHMPVKRHPKAYCQNYGMP